MRKTLVGVSALVAAIALAACTSATTATTIKQFVGSIGSQQYVQVHLTARVTGQVPADRARVLDELSIDVHAANPTGGSVTAADQNASVEILVNLGSATLADVRIVDSTLYAKVDLAALGSVPGVGIPPLELAAAQLFLGGRWFELPRSVVQHLAPPPTRQEIATSSQIEARVIDALARYIDSSRHAKTAGEFTESGSIRQLESALLPVVSGVEHRQIAPVAVPGSYVLRLSTSGTTVKGVTLSVTAPTATGGVATATFTMTVTHDPVSVVAPAGATAITPQLFRDLSIH